MTTGEWRGPSDAERLLAVAAHGLIVPGHEEYTETLREIDDSGYISTDPTPEQVGEFENNFALKVIVGSAIMVRRNSGILTILSDVDQAISEDGGETIRPAFEYALHIVGETLQDRVEFGILSTHLREGTLKRLPFYFKNLLRWVNSDFALSSHISSQEVTNLRQAAKKGDFTTVEDIVDPRIIQGTKEGRLKDFWLDPKLPILQELARNHPDRAFMLIDDLILAGVISEKHRQVMGIWVAQEMQNDYRPRLTLKDLEI